MTIHTPGPSALRWRVEVLDANSIFNTANSPIGGSYNKVVPEESNGVEHKTCLEPGPEFCVSMETRVGTSLYIGVKPARTTLSDVALYSMISTGRQLVYGQKKLMVWRLFTHLQRC